MIKPFLFSLLIFIISPVLFAQSNNEQHQSPSTVSVNAEGEINIAADILLFQITINQFKDSASEAFTQHKEQERFLTSLLIEEGIEEKSISAQPINIAPRRQSNRTGVETRQQVMITLDDISQFEAMQLTLIENGFDNFSSSFSAKEISSAKDDALDKAVKEAQRKAEILANASGKQLGQIISIQYGAGSSSPPMARTMEMAMDASSESLLQFEHTLSVKKRVSVVYELIN